MSNPVIDEEGNQFWYSEVEGETDLLHRTDGPAVELVNGDKEWWVSGMLHRIDGPAIETEDEQEWWYKGTQIEVSNLEDFKKYMKRFREISMKAFW
jgi:hypothetical protein